MWTQPNSSLQSINFSAPTLIHAYAISSSIVLELWIIPLKLDSRDSFENCHPLHTQEHILPILFNLKQETPSLFLRNGVESYPDHWATLFMVKGLKDVNPRPLF